MFIKTLHSYVQKQLFYRFLENHQHMVNNKHEIQVALFEFYARPILLSRIKLYRDNQYHKIHLNFFLPEDKELRLWVVYLFEA